MTDFESKWLTPRPNFKPNKVTITLRRDSYDEFKRFNTILKENEVVVIDMPNGEKITVIGDGKTPATECKEINFPYTKIVCERVVNNYTTTFIDAPRRGE